MLPQGTDPALVVAAGITVLLSGFALVGTVQDVTVTLALAIGPALASGVTLGQFLTRPQATVIAAADPAPDQDPQ